MTPDEYRRAGEFFDRLNVLPETERSFALAKLDVESPDLAKQVRILLEADRQAAAMSFLGQGALQDAARLISGAESELTGLEFGRYRLGRRIGSGGMGTVYEAQDLKLPRRVAVKLMSAEEHGEDRVARFEREGRAVSLLNHPNIVSILDAGMAHGFHYIVTEFIEGHTLRELLARNARGMDLESLLETLTQVASALQAAHEAGVVHRDIKPENIMTRPDGIVKVLDFGLAKLRDPGSEERGAPSMETRPGRVAGTVRYLAPEQVSGLGAEARSDLFSLGVVAYELATGSRPFDGLTDGAVYSAILNRDPQPPAVIRPELNGEIEAMILRCLEKDPDLRFQTAADLRSQCRRLMRNSSKSSSGVQMIAVPSRPRPWPWPWAAGAAALLAIVVLAWRARPTAAGNSATPSAFQRLTDAPGEETSPALTADGRQLVYASAKSGNWDIYLQRIGGGASLNLTADSPHDDRNPAVSPDGAIAFRSERAGGGLFLMESTGENPRRIATKGYLPAWSPDGKRIVYSSDRFDHPSVRGSTASLTVLNLADGSERTLDTAGDAIQPSWSPHGHRIAYWGLSAGGGRRDVFTVPAAGGGPPVPVTADNFIDWNPVWDPSGEALYFLSNRQGTMNVWRVAIDEETGQTRGEPEPVTVPAQNVGSLSIGPGGRTLVYAPALQRYSLMRVAFDPGSRAVVGKPEPFMPEHALNIISFSPDGSEAVVDTLGEVREELWIVKADGSGRRKLIADGFRNRAPSWSPAGNGIAFLSDRGGPYGIWWVDSNGGGLRPLILNPAYHMQRAAWSPDGKRLIAGNVKGPAILADVGGTPPKNRPAPGIDNGYVLFDSWAQGNGEDIALGMAEWIRPQEIMLYHANQGKLERPGIVGRFPVWLRPGGSGRDPLRYFLYLRGPECFIYDRQLRRSTLLFSAAPHALYSVSQPPDGRWIYYSVTVREADMWLARLER